jgi:diguanylate cyclase (GGDEF)-like protein
MDISVEEFGKLIELFYPIKHLLWILVVLLIITILATFFQSYRLYLTEKLSLLDPLTNLFNRKFLNKEKNNLKLDKFCIAIADIDHFKKINDSYGHNIGDIILTEFAKILQASFRVNDYIIRFGGEEFLILIHNDNIEGVLKAIERFHTKVKMHKFEFNENFSLTVSIGVNLTPHRFRNIEEAITVADRMLYLAKTNGRDRIEIYDDKRSESFGSFNRLEDIKKLINNGNLKTFYQGVLNVKTGKIEKVEALARLFDNKGSIIAPKDFLAIIKKTSAYRNLSKIMLQNVIIAIKKYNIMIHINFNVGDFLDDTIFEILTDEIGKHKKIAHYLTIELLEDEAIRDISKINSRIKVLRKLGCKIAIDDFGSGFSNYDYIISLQPDIVKIDGAIIKNISKNKTAYSILTSINDLCKKLNIQIVAEYVENKEIFALLQHIEIQYAQGYFINRPTENLETLLFLPKKYY